MKFVILPTDEKKAVSDLTSNDKYALAAGLVEREVIMCVSAMVSEFQGMQLQCESYFDVGEELQEISFSDAEPLDAKRECQLVGWEKVTDIAPDRLFQYCASQGIESLLDVDGGYGINRLYVNIDNRDFDYCVDSWDELAENQGIDLEQEPLETLEYWAITSWLASKLDNTIETLGMHIWGRTCSGQSIALDSDIEDLAIALASFEA